MRKSIERYERPTMLDFECIGESINDILLLLCTMYYEDSDGTFQNEVECK